MWARSLSRADSAGYNDVLSMSAVRQAGCRTQTHDSYTGNLIASSSFIARNHYYKYKINLKTRNKKTQTKTHQKINQEKRPRNYGGKKHDIVRVRRHSDTET